MTLSLYRATVPVFTLGFTNLAAILAKAETYAAAKKIEPGVLINARLFPDMFPFSRQIQITCDIAKGGVARLAGVDIPSFPDTESTFAELIERVKKTQAFIAGITEKQLEGGEKRAILLKVGGNEMKFDGADYLYKFVYPNFYFHSAMAYGLLRHNGLDIGKGDFLGAIQ